VFKTKVFFSRFMKCGLPVPKKYMFLFKCRRSKRETPLLNTC